MELHEVKNYFDSLFGKQNRKRFGKLFKTEHKYYFLDTGTGKLAELSQQEYKMLSLILNNEGFNFSNMNNEDLEILHSLIRYVEEEHILQAIPVTELHSIYENDIEHYLNEEVTDLVLEVTEKCNLRCKYCIYNENHPEFRNFSHKDMDIDIAKKAITFLKEHSGDEVVFLGFYGGEPLMNYRLVKEVVSFAKNIMGEKKITFSMTTNATLINEEIADFLASNEFQITISLDGSKEIHNDNRIYKNGSGTFEDTMRGVVLLSNAYDNFGKDIRILFNSVITEGDYYDKFDRMNDFFKYDSRIPKNSVYTSSLADPPPRTLEYILPESIEEIEFQSEIVEPLVDWTVDNFDKDAFSISSLNSYLSRIHNRFLSEYPVKKYGINGCCLPGHRKVYVTVDGNFKPCERIGTCPNIGDVNNGIDIKKIKKIYLDGYSKNYASICNNCWAVNLCGLCYTDCFDNDCSITQKYRNLDCISQRFTLSKALANYCRLLESGNDYIKELKHD